LRPASAALPGGVLVAQRLLDSLQRTRSNWPPQLPAWPPPPLPQSRQLLDASAMLPAEEKPFFRRVAKRVPGYYYYYLLEM